jgi:hypothetical protein
LLSLLQLLQGAKLTREVATAKHALSLPDNRLLQRFFSAIGLADVLATMHDTHLETQQSSNLSRLAALQNKIEWVEVAIVAVYMIELMHVLHNLFGHAPEPAAHVTGFPWEQIIQGSLILALAFVAGSAALWFLQPYQHGSADSKRRATGFLWLMVLLPIGYLIAQTTYYVLSQAHDKRPASNATDGTEPHTSGQGQSDHHEPPLNRPNESTSGVVPE